MRKYRNGLCAIIDTNTDYNIMKDGLFAFTNKNGRIIRFLYWDVTGFAIWTKNLDKQKYRWPKKMFSENSLGISPLQLQQIIDGLDITPHKKLEYKKLF